MENLLTIEGPACLHCEQPWRPGVDVHCLGHADPLPATVGYPLKARIGGRCSGCGEPFEPNAMIYADGQGGYLADCCWDQT